MLRELSHLERLEAESIEIFRTVAAECPKPVMLYSAGKDGSVLLHVARKAFHPAPPPFPLLHVDENTELTKISGFASVICGARRDEEESAAKERIFSAHPPAHVAEPKSQGPEVWNLYNTQLNDGWSLRIFPLANWTDIDVRQYIEREHIQ